MKQNNKSELQIYQKILSFGSSLCVNCFSTIALWAIQIEFSIARLKFKWPKKLVVVIIHTVHIRIVLTDTYFKFGCVF